jgi:hypothetical protein
MAAGGGLVGAPDGRGRDVAELRFCAPSAVAPTGVAFQSSKFGYGGTAQGGAGKAVPTLPPATARSKYGR